MCLLVILYVFLTTGRAERGAVEEPQTRRDKRRARSRGAGQDGAGAAGGEEPRAGQGAAGEETRARRDERRGRARGNPGRGGATIKRGAAPLEIYR